MEKFIPNYKIFTDAKRGGRNYMEDFLCVDVPKREDVGHQKDDLLAYFAVFDGHGGPEAAEFAKEHLQKEIMKQTGFWTDDDVQVSRAIKDGFCSTHKLMRTVMDSWPKTNSGLPSTAGTTASVVILKNKKLYVAHVGDSSIVLGTQVDNAEEWSTLTVTKEHKPDAPEELKRIHDAGGHVMCKAGIARVVWKRSRVGPKRRFSGSGCPFEMVPFLAVARSLGDLWSYNSDRDVFVVSPEPDVAIYNLDDCDCRCVILASDGVWNMVGSEEAMRKVHSWMKDQKDIDNRPNPAEMLVDLALDRWQNKKIRADNTSAVVVLLNSDANNRNNSELPNARETHARITRSTSALISPSKSCLLPLHQNLQPTVDNKTHSDALPCEKTRSGHVRLAKEDRVGAKWKKMKRKPGLRVRFLSGGLIDVRSALRLHHRRHSSPIVRSKGLLGDDLRGLLPSSALETTPRVASEDRSKLEGVQGLGTSKDRPNCPVSESSSFVSSPFVSLKTLDLSAEHHETFNRSNVSSSTDEQLLADGERQKTVTCSSAMSFIVGCVKPTENVITNKDSTTAVGKTTSTTRKRKSSGVEAVTAKQRCLGVSRDDCLQTYRTRYHTRLRIPLD